MVSSPFESLLGQQQAITLLTRAIECDRIAPAYLFVGPEGVGRTLAAKAFLSRIIQIHNKGHRTRTSADNHPDILWVEPTYLQSGKLIPASAFDREPEARPKSRPQIRVAQIRDITKFVNQAPLESSRLLVIVDQAELMGEASANGLLKTLEEPGNASLILISTTVETLLPTIVSRCQRIPFHPLSQTDMNTILTRQGYGDILEDPQVTALAMGSPGKAITHWEMRASIETELLNRCMTLPKTDLDALYIAKDIEASLDMPTQLWLIDYLQQHYWYQTQNRAVVNLFEETKTALKQYVQPLLTWEVTWLKIYDSEH
ncbi:MAG: AAA family ATPase [Acaryochloridaceae cyanobacterium RL_2_7]|nr:AAA family ATPase [Acaryochloridaceae cyanobacterium RL_2_7]